MWLAFKFFEEGKAVKIAGRITALRPELGVIVAYGGLVRDEAITERVMPHSRSIGW